MYKAFKLYKSIRNIFYQMSISEIVDDTISVKLEKMFF